MHSPALALWAFYHARMARRAHGPSRAASLMLCERSERADNKLDNGRSPAECGPGQALLKRRELEPRRPVI